MCARWIVAAGVGSIAVTIVVSLPAKSREGEPQDSITLPTRQSQAVPHQPQLPELPSSAENLSPKLLTITTRWEESGGKQGSVRQTVLRTHDRSHVAVEGAQSEWLFVRNPIDHRRVSGSLIDHRAKRVLAYNESDLRDGQGVRGWLDIVTLRFDRAALRTLRNTGRRQVQSGIEFVEYVAPDPTLDGVVEVWWSERCLLPSRFVTRQSGRVTSSVTQVESTGVDNGLLLPPRQRFPRYALLDIADAREGGPHSDR